MNSSTSLAHGKLNLTLRIVGRLENGFHLLQTLLCPLELADEIELSVGAGSGEVELDCELTADLRHHMSHLVRSDEQLSVLSNPQENLVGKAAALFLKRTSFGSSKRVQIRLRKRLPLAAGLGGGSADAACVLVELNRLTGNTLSLSELRDLGAQIGSDVPALLARELAFSFGRGEHVLQFTKDELEAFRPLEELGVVLVKPPFGIPARVAYERFDERTPFSAFSDWSDYQRGSPNAAGEERERLIGLAQAWFKRLKKHDTTSGAYRLQWDEDIFYSFTQLLCNDLTAPVFSLYPAMGVIQRALFDHGVRSTLLVGSGSTVAGFTPSHDIATSVTEQLRNVLGPGTFLRSTRFVVSLP